MYNFIYNETLSLEIARLKVELSEYTIQDIYNQLNILKNANDNLIKEIDKVSKKILNKKYLRYYEESSNTFVNALKSETNNK